MLLQVFENVQQRMKYLNARPQWRYFKKKELLNEKTLKKMDEFVYTSGFFEGCTLVKNSGKASFSIL